jgi:hypothetical protein
MYLQQRGFELKGVYNLSYDKAGQAVQGDFFLERRRGISAA